MQGAKASASKRHWKVAPGSFEENVKVGVVSSMIELSAGPESIVVTGRVVSTVKVREAGDGVEVAVGIGGADVEGVAAVARAPL